MKASEVRAGVEYAVGSSSKYGRDRLAHVRVVEPRVRVERGNGVPAGIYHVVEVIEDVSLWSAIKTLRDGRRVVESRQLQLEWAPYVTEREERRAIAAEREAEEKRVRELSAVVERRLLALGISAERDFYGSKFTIKPDEMLEIVERLEAPCVEA